jgi:hypothetical protein
MPQVNHMMRQFAPAFICLLLASLACNLGVPETPAAPPASDLSEPPAVEVEAPPTAGSGDEPAPAVDSGSTTAASTITISGYVWQDICNTIEAKAGDPPPPGCINYPDGSIRANGFQEPGEPGLAGVSVVLREGRCDSTIWTAVLTDSSGFFSFDVTIPGSYCVYIDPLESPNDSILIPGDWTFPESSGGFAYYQFSLDETMPTMGSLDFGWDYQLAP